MSVVMLLAWSILQFLSVDHIGRQATASRHFYELQVEELGDEIKRVK